MFDNLTLPPPPPSGDEEDHVSNDTSSEALLGVVVDYLYSTGRHYQLTFDDNFHVKFAWLNAPPLPDGKTFEAPNLPYRARELRPGLIFVHWMVKPASIHVALNIDLTERKIHVGAMMPPNKWEFWDTADIVGLSVPGKG